MRSTAIQRWKDLSASLVTVPGWRTWRTCALVYGLFLLCAGPIGALSGLLRPGWPHLLPVEMLGGGVLLFVQPALAEEIVFRGLLLPRNTASIGRGRLVLVAGTALAVYVVAHPVNAMLFRPQALGLFERPAYLVLAGLLGLTCTATYWISRSIWPPVVIHWLTVVAWLWFLGGQALLC